MPIIERPRNRDLDKVRICPAAPCVAQMQLENQIPILARSTSAYPGDWKAGADARTREILGPKFSECVESASLGLAVVSVRLADE